MAKLEQVRVDNEATQKWLTYVLKEHHDTHGIDTWIPIPDLAKIAGMSPEAAERLLRQMAGTQMIQFESTRALDGFTDEKYRRGPDKGWWTAVKMLPPDVAEKKRKAIREHREKMDRAQHLVNEAFRIAYGDGLPVKAVVYDDGRIAVVPSDDDRDEGEAAESMLILDPKKRALPTADLPRRRSR